MKRISLAGIFSLAPGVFNASLKQPSFTSAFHGAFLGLCCCLMVLPAQPCLL